MLIFDEATSALDPPTAEAFARTINQLKGKVTMLFVCHALPRTLQVDEIFVIGGGHLKKAAMQGNATCARPAKRCRAG